MLKILSSAERASLAAPVTPVDAKQLQIIPSLDGLRAVSVLIVVMAHAGIEVVPGGLGVTIFFFLSGYLISTLMLGENEKTGGINIPKFYARRVFRLMPPLLVTLAIAYALTSAKLLTGGITVAGIASQLLYFANYYVVFFDQGNTIPDGTGILWSLAVEEHFYIFYPLFLTLLLGSASVVRLRTIGLLLGVACVAILAWRIHLAHAPGFTYQRTYFASDTRIDSIIYGCVLAVLKNPVRDRNRAGTDRMSAWQWALLAVAFGMLLFTLVYRDTTFRETYRYSIQGLALIPIFYFAVRFSGNPLFRHLNSPLATIFGTWSYAIYLIHLVVIWTIVTCAPAAANRPLVLQPLVLLPIVLLVSVAYAAVIDRFVDPYFRRLRHRYRTTGFDRSRRDGGQRSERLESHNIAAE